jgi:hypothetical protein
MTRDDEIQAIVEAGRRTRARLPRSLWIAAAILGAVGTLGLGLALLGEPARAPAHAAAPAPTERSPPGTGWGAGLAIGAAGGLVVGWTLGRHRAHSSRSRP